MGKIEKILKKGPVEGQTTEVYPVTSTKAVYDENNKRLDNIITGLQESVYLNTPIPISTDNTTESMAQNVKNITDYIEKAKAVGIEDVNGMAVTCLIDDFFSGVGYIMGNTDVAIQGIKIPDDIVDNAVFTIYNGRYDERFIVGVDEANKVTSSMLVQGARKPIIFTPDTTEVDEETYQKLLSDDVDVLFKLSETVLLPLQGRDKSDTYLYLYFSFINFDADALDIYDSTINAVSLLIKSSTPHTVSSSVGEKSFDMFLSNYIDTSITQSVFQEIDLTGTDADRKAKLDQFERNWKALTGSSDLAGARFIGYTGEPDNFIGIFIYNSSIEGGYSAIATSDGLSTYQVFISPTGAMISNSLFYHLEPVIIRTDNTDSDMAYNVAAIQKYINNLTFLGVYTYGGFTIPVSLTGNEFCGYLICNKYHEGDRLVLSGTVFFEGIAKIIVIDETGRYTETVEIAGTDPLNTNTSNMVDAINVLNTIVKKNIFESITLNAGNTNEDMAANVATINAYITNLKALGVDTTKGFMVSVNVNLPSDSGYYGYMASHYVQGSYFLSGTIFKNDAGENYVKNITINPMGRYDEIVSTAS